jgi:nicotinate-nucleotide--dimethylbenzimidazole phosphoribosyltransferase
MRYFGGLEMIAAMGAMLRAAELKMIILVDGFIMTACMAMAMHIAPAIRHYAIFAHQGDESGHSMWLKALGVKPILSLGLRLGEGTGALCAYPIVDSAVRMMHEMNTFEESEITKYF